MRWLPLTLSGLAILTAGVSTAAPPPTFGMVRFKDGAVVPIVWQPAAGVSVSTAALRFDSKGVIRSGQLPLQPLRLYDIAAALRRGPGTRNHFAIVFEDACGVQHQRVPMWEYPDASRPEWFPVSPYRQPYVQGLILPPGTRRVWLELAVDGPETPELAPYLAWEVTSLEVCEREPVPFGKEPGANRLEEGNIQSPVPGTKVPAGWTIWGQGSGQLDILETTAADRRRARSTSASAPEPMSSWRPIACPSSGVVPGGFLCRPAAQAMFS